MGDYCDGIERINIELSLRNKLRLCHALSCFLEGELPLRSYEDRVDKTELIGDRRAQALTVVEQVRERWQWLYDNLDLPLQEAEAVFNDHGITASELTIEPSNQRCFTAYRIILYVCPGSRNYCHGYRKFLKAIISGRSLNASMQYTRRFCVVACLWHYTCTPVTATCTLIYRSTLIIMKCSRKPIRLWWRIMALARSLGGVISGEHGIGITKYEFLSTGRTGQFSRLQTAYRS